MDHMHDLYDSLKSKLMEAISTVENEIAESQQILEGLRQKLNALELLRSELGVTGHETLLPREQPSSAATPIPREPVTEDLVLKAARELQEPFTHWEVTRQMGLSEESSRQVRITLNRLAQKNLIEIRHKGSGNRASIFQNPAEVVHDNKMS